MKQKRYDPKFAVDIYMFARMGYSNTQMKTVLGFTKIDLWIQRFPEVKYALEQARNSKKPRTAKEPKVETLQEYVYRQMPASLKVIWDEIDASLNQDLAQEKIESILSNHSERVRQHLWLHAMIYTNFNQSEASRRVNVSKTTLDRWKDQDPNFPKLIEELQWHKKNYFEAGLIELVAERHPLAVIFANKTLNADRGYSDKLTVTHQGEVTHNHNHVVKISELGLPLEVMIMIRDRIKALKTVKPIELPAAKKESFYDEREEQGSAAR